MSTQLSIQDIQAELSRTRKQLKAEQKAKKPPKKKQKVEQEPDNDTDDPARELRDEKNKKKESIQHHEWDDDESEAQEDAAVDRAVKYVLTHYSHSLPRHLLESVSQSVAIEPFPEIPPELLQEITTAHSTLSREAFITDFECSFIETKDYQLKVDLSDVVKGMDMEVDDLQPVGPFATEPISVSETCIDFSTGVQAVQRDHTVFTEVTGIVIAGDYHFPDTVALPENIGIVAGEKYKGEPAKGTLPANFIGKSLFTWKTHVSSLPLLFTKTRKLAKELSDPKTRTKYCPKTLEDQTGFALACNPDQLQDPALAEALEWQLCGAIERQTLDTTSVQLVKDWNSVKDDPKKASDKESKLKTVTVDNFQASSEREIKDNLMYRFGQMESDTPAPLVFTSDCTDRQAMNSQPVHGMGCLSPHNRVHLYDTVIFPTCLEEEDNTGNVHGSKPDCKNPTNYFAYVRGDPQLTYTATVNYNLWEISNANFKKLFGFSPEQNPHVTHKKLVGTTWKPNSMLTNTELYPHQTLTPSYRSYLHRNIHNVLLQNTQDNTHFRDADSSHLPTPAALVYSVSEFLSYMIGAYNHPMNCTDGNPFKQVALTILRSNHPTVQASVKSTFKKAGLDASRVKISVVPTLAKQVERQAKETGMNRYLMSHTLNFRGTLPTGMPYCGYFSKGELCKELYDDLSDRTDNIVQLSYWNPVTKKYIIMPAVTTETFEEVIDIATTGKQIDLCIESE